MYKFLLKRKIKKIVKHSERKRTYHNLKEIKSILVLFDTENFDDANHFIQQMKKMKKRVKAFAYKDINDTTIYSSISYIIATEKDIKDLKLEALTQMVNSLSDDTFDLVVDFSLKENLLLLYILVSVNSSFKVGFFKHTLPVHDIVISFAPGMELSVKELGNQLIHYLTTISSDGGNSL